MWINELKTFVDTNRQLPVTNSGDVTINETDPNAGGHSVKVRGIPPDSAVFKLEHQGRPLASFWNISSPCNRICDALAYVTHKGVAYMVFFELKSGTLDQVNKQFQSTAAVGSYILEALQQLGINKPPKQIKQRFVLFTHRRLDKRIRRPKRMKKKIGDITIQETSESDVNFSSLLGEH